MAKKIRQLHWQHVFQVLAGPFIILDGIANANLPRPMADKLLVGAAGLWVTGVGILGIFDGTVGAIARGRRPSGRRTMLSVVTIGLCPLVVYRATNGNPDEMVLIAVASTAFSWCGLAYASITCGMVSGWLDDRAWLARNRRRRLPGEWLDPFPKRSSHSPEPQDQTEPVPELPISE